MGLNPKLLCGRQAPNHLSNATAQLVAMAGEQEMGIECSSALYNLSFIATPVSVFCPVVTPIVGVEVFTQRISGLWFLTPGRSIML
jgi:hypothetical protein